MRSNELTLSANLSPKAQLAQQLATAGQALMRAAALLGGRGISGFAPVGQLGPACGLTVNEAISEFLFAKARAQRSDRYLRQLRVSLKSFALGRFRHPLDAVTTSDVEKWMLSKDWAPKTAHGYVSDVRGLYRFAIRRGYLDRNPAAGVELPVLDTTSTIAVHTADQVSQVLKAARRVDLDMCRVLAIRYFAGIRAAEVHRLRETDLKLDQGLIEVPAVKSKTRARRLVTIQPNLRAWLDLGGELHPFSDHTLRDVIRLSGVLWCHNVPRHSFVSYHLAQFQNAGKTALEAGHSEQMTFSHYRALVTPQAAAEYWAIVPS